jgi:hypothetical protein
VPSVRQRTYSEYQLNFILLRITMGYLKFKKINMGMCLNEQNKSSSKCIVQQSMKYNGFISSLL